MVSNSQRIIAAARSQLMVIDLQERLLPAMKDPESILKRAEAIVESATELGIPLLMSEQYPQGLGTTIKSLRELAGGASEAVSKVEFSCMAHAGLASRVLDQAAEAQRDQVIIVGVEAHVCVLQTALDLVARDVQVYVVADATGSRKQLDYELSLSRMRQEGVRIVSTEMLLFEWVKKAGTESFRAASKRVKAFN